MYWKLKVTKRSDSRAGEALEFCEKNLLCNNFSLHFIVFSKRTFYENYSTSDSHTNTVILRLLAYPSRYGVENRDKAYLPIRLKGNSKFAESVGGPKPGDRRCLENVTSWG